MTTSLKRRVTVGALASLLVAAGAACSNTRPTGDSPTGRVDDTAAEVINFPDQFANVATKCDGHGHRLYSTTRQAAPVVVSDSGCGGS